MTAERRSHQQGRLLDVVVRLEPGLVSRLDAYAAFNEITAIDISTGRSDAARALLLRGLDKAEAQTGNALAAMINHVAGKAEELIEAGPMANLMRQMMYAFAEYGRSLEAGEKPGEDQP